MLKLNAVVDRCENGSGSVSVRRESFGRVGAEGLADGTMETLMFADDC